MTFDSDSYQYLTIRSSNLYVLDHKPKNYNIINNWTYND